MSWGSTLVMIFSLTIQLIHLLERGDFNLLYKYFSIEQSVYFYTKRGKSVWFTLVLAGNSYIFISWAMICQLFFCYPLLLLKKFQLFLFVNHLNGIFPSIQFFPSTKFELIILTKGEREGWQPKPPFFKGTKMIILSW